MFATLANADDWVEMALFAETYQEYLKKYIELKNEVPSHDTLCRVMGLISPDVLQQLYGKWQELLNREEGERIKKIICIDGKTLRGNKRKEENPAHIVSAWCKEDGFCLGQKAVEVKSNEITAIPDLLDKLKVKGQIITIDAMGTQKEIVEKIRSKRADYVLAVKRNQKTLHEEIREYFVEESFCKKITFFEIIALFVLQATKIKPVRCGILYRAIFFFSDNQPQEQLAVRGTLCLEPEPHPSLA